MIVINSVSLNIWLWEGALRTVKTQVTLVLLGPLARISVCWRSLVVKSNNLLRCSLLFWTLLGKVEVKFLAIVEAVINIMG
jgi:hypothetical protein